MSKHNKKYSSGDHLVICQSCGAQRYRSECDYTWDGYLMCHVRGCWYEKDPIFEIPPVILDPAAIYDVSPDQVSGTETYIDNLTGLQTTWGGPHFGRGSDGGRAQWGSWHVRFGSIDEPPDYIGS